MSLNLERATFGNAPAALYLTLLLNERDDQKLARKVARILQETRELLHDTVRSHLFTTELSARSLSRLLVLIDERMKRSVLAIPDKFIEHIVSNILTGEIRAIKARCISAAKEQKSLFRGTEQGETPERAKAVQLQSELNRIDCLQQKSRKYLDSKAKQCTLY